MSSAGSQRLVGGAVLDGAVRPTGRTPGPDRDVHRRLCRGDIDGLLHILDPEVTGTIDTFAQLVVTGASRVAPNLLRYWSGPDHTLVSYPVGSQPARSARR